MRDSYKTGIIVLALAVGTFALQREAKAGNAAITGAEYFSVEFTLGEYLSHTNSEAVLIVDDITYSVDYAPCDPVDNACSFFTGQDFPPVTTGSSAPGIPGGGFSLGGDLSGVEYRHGGGTQQGGWATQSSVLKNKRCFNEVGLMDTNGSDGDQHIFDRFSFSTYGQLAVVQQREWQYFLTYGEVYKMGGEGTGSAGNGFAAAAGGLGLTRALAVPMTTFSVPSSGSRHYQSPHIVGAGRRVHFKNISSSTGMTGWVDVKGRVILSPNTPPTVNTGVQILWP